MTEHYSEATETARSYYDAPDTDQMYTLAWGGEHIHYGIYAHPDEPIHAAAQRTVETMAETLETLSEASRVIDLGAGYGGSARHLARTYGCSVVCLNISSVQNRRNRQLNQEQGLSHLIEVQEGSFESIPFPADSFDIVWSQDAILHSSNRRQVLEEIRRILMPGGELVFTDPLQSESCPPGLLQPAFDRLGIANMGSASFYRHTARALGFEEVQFIDLSQHVSTHYRRLGEEVRHRYDEAVDRTSRDFVEKTIKSLEPWQDYYAQGHMQWGIWHFRLSKNKSTEQAQTIFFFREWEEPYGCFSNFSPHGFELDGHWWPTSEHYFQAQKFVGTPHVNQIRLASTPAEAARMGRERTRPLRNDWEEVKEDVMERGLLCKFQTHPELGQILLDTGDAYLVENAPRDHYWGCGADGSGLNRLGEILMNVRVKLRNLS